MLIRYVLHLLAMVGMRFAMGNCKPMKSSNLKSTFDLVMKSEHEDKNRSVLETVIYALFILSAAFSIWQAAIQTVAVPTRVGVATLEACHFTHA
jgi:hypothetical protein